MTLEAALKQQGIDPNTVTPQTKAQLENVLLEKGKEVLILVLQILLNQNKQVFNGANSTSEAELKAQLEAARLQAEAEAQAAEAKKKRQRLIVGVVVGVVVVAGIVVYIFTKKR